MRAGFANFIVLACALVASQTFAGPGPACPIKGVALGVYLDTTEEEIESAVKEIAALGANAVLIKFAEVQDDWRSDTIAPDPHWTISLRQLRHAIRTVRGAGLEVALMPIVLLRSPRRRTDWRGMIEPRDPDRWFGSYSGMISKYARLAAEEKAAYFGVGSELVSMERFEDRWRDLIAGVRTLFPARLFYSSNWDHLGKSAAWRDLDLLGLNAYYELAGENEPVTLEKLEERWKKILPEIRKWGRGVGKELLLTEVGYPSRKGGLSDPWDHLREAPPDLSVQALGYRAFLEAWEKEKRVAGVFFYEWRGAGGAGDPGYTPRGKEALQLLLGWMGRN